MQGSFPSRAKSLSPLTSIRGEVKNGWSYASSPLYAFMAWTGAQEDQFRLKQLILFKTPFLPVHCTGITICLFTHTSSLLSTGLTVFTLWLIYCINCRGMFYCARFDILAVALLKIQIFWDTMLCHWVLMI